MQQTYAMQVRNIYEWEAGSRGGGGGGGGGGDDTQLAKEEEWSTVAL